MDDATITGFVKEGVIVVAVAVSPEADTVRLLAKSKLAKIALPNHIRVDEGITKKDIHPS